MNESMEIIRPDDFHLQSPIIKKNKERTCAR